MVMSTACRKPSTSNAPLGPRNFIKFSEARLQAVSSRNMYSEQGFEALMRAVALQVCQRLTVESYRTPGAPECQAVSEIFFSRSRAPSFSEGDPSVTLRVHQSRSASTACMNSSVTRTEWLAFWKKTELYASPSIELS